MRCGVRTLSISPVRWPSATRTLLWPSGIAVCTPGHKQRAFALPRRSSTRSPAAAYARRRRTQADAGAPGGSAPWVVAGQGAAALAVSMGIGRFVYTPILPLMHAQAGLTSSAGALLATANYVGYLAGALAGILVPALVRSVLVMRVSIVVLIVTLALMPVTQDEAAWLGLGMLGGVRSVIIFMFAVSAVLSHLREHGQHLAGWAFGGVGAGVALSGVLVLVV